ncbi:L,D-transpeptidase [Priestia megaterium]|uniref:L,D-transpeptidase n=1 Tax=Priestia megaterium TaxID=1404 RepID=UPI002415B69A|nr:L,D-transpeptidase [Priestia megaterium]
MSESVSLHIEIVDPVETGKTWDKTPVGFFKVVNKIKNRPYYTGHIPGGDPRNPLGKRWLGLSANGTYGDTYGVHDNNNKSSIGKYVSQGCVRMHNVNIEKLYDKVQVGTPVAITYSYKSFVDLTNIYGYKFKGYKLKTINVIAFKSRQTLNLLALFVLFFNKALKYLEIL